MSRPSSASRHSPSEPTPYATGEHTLATRYLFAANRVFCRAYHSLRVVAPSALPPTGPAILICNHTSSLDPMLIQSVCKRIIVWMMAAEYYDVPVLRSVFRTMQTIPVERGRRDLTATRDALRALKAGRVLGIFPEGKIARTPRLLPFQSGFAALASKTGAPVYPAYLGGTQRGQSMALAISVPQDAAIAFGPPLLPSKNLEPSILTADAERAVMLLSDAVEKQVGTNVEPA